MDKPIEKTLDRLLCEAGIPTADARTASPIPISGLSVDSRTVRAGELFIAIPGMHTDARRFLSDAVGRGAAAVVTESEETLDDLAVPQVRVPNARVAAACLYDAWYDHPARRLRVVGVTGTNGKTTVSAMLRHILCEAGIPSGVIGTVGGVLPHDAAYIDLHGMTTPDPWELYPLLARMLPDSPTDTPPVVVMEVTSHALRLGKVAPLRFEVGVFTNLTPEHMDLHGTMEDYYASKRRLFAVTRHAVINADDRWGRMLLGEPLPVRHWFICHASGLDRLPPDRMCPAGEGSCTRVYAEQPRLLGEEGVSFKLTTPDLRLRLRCPAPGEFSVMNALQAATAALALGVSPAAVRDALRTFPGVAGRMERVMIPPTCTRMPENVSIYIDFAHTPDALEKLLGIAHSLRREDRRSARRIVLLFGCGGDRDRSKRKIMGRIASRMADFVILTSDNSRTENPGVIIDDILRGVDKESAFAVIPNRREAIEYAVSDARPGDILLLAGKGHETYEIDAEGMHPFSEKDIILETARSRFSPP